MAWMNGHTTNTRNSANGSPRKTSMKLTRSNVSGRRDLLRRGAFLVSVAAASADSVT
jgi:hypothetical protein